MRPVSTMATMEDQYNKMRKAGDQSGCLIGNWVEERVLMSNTGEARYRRWEDSIGEEGPRDDSIVGKRWTKGGEKADRNDSYNRCFVHYDRDEYANVQSFNESSYVDPKKCTGPREYRDVGQGARSRLTQQEMWEMATAAAEQQAEEENRNVLEEPLVSTAQEAFQAPPSGAYKKVIGARVMKTRDGRDIPKDSRDLTFLRETGIRHPEQGLNTCDVSNVEHMPEAHAGDLYSSKAVTFYSAPVARGGEQGFAGRAGTTNYARDDKFSVPIEYSREKEKI